MRWKDRVLEKMVEVEILRSLKSAVSQDSRAENRGECVLWCGQERSAARCGPGAFYREDGSVINIPILQLFAFQKVRFLENGVKRKRFVLKVLYGRSERNRWAI